MLLASNNARASGGVPRPPAEIADQPVTGAGLGGHRDGDGEQALAPGDE